MTPIINIKHKIYQFLVFPLALLYWIIMPPKPRRMVMSDLRQWAQWRNLKPNVWGFAHLMGAKPEFRTVFYKRVRLLGIISCWWLRGQVALDITTNDIGEGLMIQHGFATIISAKKIGNHCKIYQQVTIGFDHNNQAPIIGNNVEICCGAKVIGGITIGDNVLIGANAVVIKDVPSNSVVAGVPAKVVRHLDRQLDLTAL